MTGRIEAISTELDAQAVPSDELGHLTDEAAALLRSSGIVRMLQAKEWGGYEAHPADFLEAVMTTAAIAPSAGWVAGVVGVHPWELSMADPQLQQELWGTDKDTWVASPYAPMGRAVPTEGGLRLTGRWSFSSGTDLCNWVVIGGLITNENGEPTGMRHFVLPREDYQIVDDSWQVVGLQGTGSKDLIVEDAFVPDYRTIDVAELLDGTLAASRRPGSPLYALPFGVLFSYAISSATVGMSMGALAAFITFTEGRVTLDGSRASQHTHQLTAMGEATADINAARAVLLSNAHRMFDITSAGGQLSPSDRITFRNDQVRAARRAVDAVDTLFRYAGGGALRTDLPIQRYWRDAHAAMNHLCNVADPIHQSYSSDRFGGPITALFY